MKWLLESSIRNRIMQAEQAGLMPTASQQADIMARHEASLHGAMPTIMSIAGDQAQIDIKGVLTNTPNFLAMLFGGGNTTYPEIITALAAAENDESIKDITLAIDSPGGHIAGLFDVLDAIARADKPVTAMVSNLAASAAFALASQADEIVAANQATEVGSIGVAIDIHVSENVVSVASTEAPKKRPDVTTPEGVAVVRENLDDLHQIFVEAISAGRSAAVGKSLSVNDINADFGQGGLVLARQALELGMIDSIAQPGPQAVVSGDGSDTHAAAKRAFNNPVIDGNKKSKQKTNNREVKLMNLNQLKIEHPAIFAEAVAEGIKTGVTQERDRVVAHLIHGKSAGVIDVATKAIEDGIEMTAAMTATYLTAGQNKGDIEAREEDDKKADAALKGVDGSEGKSQAEIVAQGVVAGIKGEDVAGADAGINVNANANKSA